MSYYGYIVVTVEDHRTEMTSADNGEVRPTGIKQVVRIEDAVADELVERDIAANAAGAEAVNDVVKAIREVRGWRQREDMREQWESATQELSPRQMRAALKAIREAR